MNAPHENARLGWYTVDLGASAPPDASLVGGKGEGLAILAACGCRVPTSFCVTTRAYDEVISALARGCDSIQELSERVLEYQVSGPLFDELSVRLRRFSHVRRWAVRSSAVGEDSLGTSFAGIQESILDVEGTDEVVDAIRRVWSSGLRPEVMMYRERMGLEPTPSSMAVVVQAMLEPTISGVMFSSNPMGSSEEAVITVAEGLGDKVVEGREGQTYYVEKSSTYVRSVEPNGSPELLDVPQINALVVAARRVEQLRRSAQDVEFAFAPDVDGRVELFMLQSRPVTSAPAEDTTPTVWTNTNVGEALPGVGTPLTWSIIRRFSRKGFERAFGSLGLTVPEEYELVGSHSGRVYLNLTQFMSVASAIPVMRPETLFALAGGGGATLVQDVYERRSPLSFLAKLPVTVPRVLASQLSMPFVAPLWESYFTGRCERFFGSDLTRRNQTELAEILGELERLFDLNGMVMLTVSSNFLMSYIVSREALKMLGGERALVHERALFSGLSVKSAEPGFAMLELGRRARRSLRLRNLIASSDPSKTLDVLRENKEHEDVADFLERIDDFRKAYGHRAPREAELSTPRWREDTTFVFEVLKGFIESPSLPSARELEREQRRSQASAHEALDDLFGATMGGLMRGVMSFTRANARRRESLRSLVVDSLDMYRRFFLECGDRMTKVGQLGRPEDVFFLTVAEVRSWLEDPSVAESFAMSILARKALHETWKSMPDPPGTFMKRGQEIVSEDSLVGSERGGAARDEVNGLPGSSGRATGRARVMFDPHDEQRLQPGEILVVPYADVGWTPLFLNASAVVMSLGGPLSHACVVAREYGIPAVVNAKSATEKIESGDIVTVDGDRGIVRVEKRARLE